MLVTQDGLFSGHDTLKYCPRSGLHPNWRLARFQPVGGGLGWCNPLPHRPRKANARHKARSRRG